VAGKEVVFAALAEWYNNEKTKVLSGKPGPLLWEAGDWLCSHGTA